MRLKFAPFIVFTSIICSISFCDPALSAELNKWSKVKAKGDSNSAPELLQRTCRTSNNALLGAAIGGAFGSKVSRNKKRGAMAGAMAGAIIGSLFSRGGCDTSDQIIALSDPIYLYPQFWSSVKAQGVAGSAPY